MQASNPVIDNVLTAIAAVKHISRDRVSADQSLAELGFDSLDTMNLLFELEEIFQISIPDEEARRVRTVEDIVAGIRKLTAAAAAGSSGDRAA